MRRYTYISFLLVILAAFVVVPHVEAASFSQAYIRLDRQAASTATTGLVCATPATTAVENSVQVTFPSGYTVSTSTSNWTVSTANIPSGATAWTGIGTATSVSGQTVTFPSSNLTVGTQYCFQWSSSAALTTSAASENKTATVATYTSGSTVIDSTNIGLSTIAADQLTVSASVAALATDGDISLSTDPASTKKLVKDDTVLVTIQYRSQLSSAQYMQIVASWDKGRIEGSSSEIIDAFSYVVNSATSTDGSVAPVINTTARTITWTISSQTPSSSYSSVSFRLKALDTSTTQNVLAKINANGTLLSTTLSSASVDLTIKGVSASSGSSSSSSSDSSSSSSSSPTATPTPTPSSQRSSFIFSKLDMTTISNTKARILFSTSQSSTYSIRYGTQLNALTQEFKDITSDTSHIVDLNGLTPKTAYYFVITAKNKNGDSIKSDIYTFITSTQDIESLLLNSSTSIYWENLIVANNSSDTLTSARNTPFTISIHIPLDHPVREVIAKVITKDVLGIMTTVYAQEIQPASIETRLIESLPGILSGQLRTPLAGGEYQIQLTIRDPFGGYTQQYLPYTIFNTDPLTVVHSMTGRPVEGARISFEYFNTRTKIYEPLAKSFKVPTFTDENGQLSFILPNGIYQVTITADGFISQTIKLELGSHPKFPTIQLNPDLSVKAQFLYARNGLAEIITYVNTTLGNIATSHKARDILFGVHVLFLLLTLGLLNYDLRNPQKLRTFASWIFQLEFLYIIDLLLFLTCILSIVLIVNMDYVRGVFLLFLVAANGFLWIQYARKMWKNKSSRSW